MNDLAEYVRQTAVRARAAARCVATATTEQKNRWLQRSAEFIRTRTAEVIAANVRDLERAPEFGLNSAAVDRLRLTEERLFGVADAVDDIVRLPDPIGEIFESRVRPNGLRVSRVRVPLGVIFFIYESRPNVTVDAAALCVKSGNAVILRGGKEAFHSNHALHQLLTEALSDASLPADAVQLVETTDRDAVGHFLTRHEDIDVTIPRGGKSLIRRVAAEATMPVIKHFDGVCHVYVDRRANLAMAEELVFNSKCQRPGVCNAAESLLVHADVAKQFLPRMAARLRDGGVELRVCGRTAELVPDAKLATDNDFGTEFLDLIMSVKIVDGLDDAMEHISRFGSHHTDAIITDDLPASERFTSEVDSAAVVVNASTRFHDGGAFGLGAEIGISTDRFHARGPCGLRELTSYKYVVHGSGQIRT